MFSIRELNIAIELWGAVFCLVGNVCVALFTQVDKRYRMLLLAMFTTELVSMCGDAAAGIFRGREGTLAWFATHAGNLLTYIMGYLLLLSFFSYLCARLEESTSMSFDRTLMLARLICGLACLMAAFGLFYYIDEHNVYHRTEWYWICQIPIIAICLMSSMLLLRNRSNTPRKEVLFFFACNLLPIPTSLIQMFVYGLNYAAISSTIGIVIIFLEAMAHSAQLLANRTQQLTKSREELAESRIAVMVSQIQPHFLFNTLDSIYYLCVTDSQLAANAVDKFSTYLRANLDSLNRTTAVPISTELAHVRTYLELEKISKAELLEYHIGSNPYDFFVPALSVQTIVENAVRHGIGKQPGGGTVTVHVSEDIHVYRIEVSDDGVGFNADETSYEDHVGIQNTRARLASMCNGTLDVQSIPNVGTTVIICIPKERTR